MKRILQVIGVLTILYGCNSEGSELRETWIAKYAIDEVGTKNEYLNDRVNAILKFEKDSIRIKNFDLAILTNTNEFSDLSYELGSKEICTLDKNNARDTFSYELSYDTLTLNYHKITSSTFIFEKLPKYNLGHLANEFQKQLISSSFIIFDSIRLEFKVDGKIIASDFDFRLGDKERWLVDTFDGELFLLIDGYPGAVFQISEIDTASFKGILYGLKNDERIFAALENSQKFNLEDLYGKWLEREYIGIPLLDTSISDATKPYYKREELHFGDSILDMKHEYRTRSEVWEINREHDLIVFPYKGLLFEPSNWRIETLSKNKLIIERVKKDNFSSKKTIERKEFVRE